MMGNRDDKLAFPNGLGCLDGGMTLRDWFAGQALLGVCADFDFENEYTAARWCYKVADAMLRERARGKGQDGVSIEEDV